MESPVSMRVSDTLPAGPPSSVSNCRTMSKATDTAAREFGAFTEVSLQFH